MLIDSAKRFMMLAGMTFFATQSAAATVHTVEKVFGNAPVTTTISGVPAAATFGQVLDIGDSFDVGAGAVLRLKAIEDGDIGTAHWLDIFIDPAACGGCPGGGGGGESGTITDTGISVSPSEGGINKIFTIFKVITPGSLRGKVFTIRTPVATAGVRGSEVVVSYDPSNGETLFSVISGEGYFESDPATSILAGQWSGRDGAGAFLGINSGLASGHLAASACPTVPLPPGSLLFASALMLLGIEPTLRKRSKNCA
jgi:hypothetical protein